MVWTKKHFNGAYMLMYSSAQRSYTTVVDEPIHAHYLKNIDVKHPGDEGDDEIVKAMENDGEKVLQSLFRNKHPTHLLFLKNRAHHWANLDDRHLLKGTNIFLTRPPYDMLPSPVKQIPNPILRDTGLKKQVESFHFLKEKPVALDAVELLKNPTNILKCSYTNVPYT